MRRRTHARDDEPGPEPAVAAEVAELRAEVGELRAAMAELLEVARQTDHRVERMAVHLEETEHRLMDTQALLARVRADVRGDAVAVERARAADDYALAWDEPEPLVSVRIATYQGAALLAERTLPSVLAQTYERWECIVVGDAVTDDTAARIAALGDPRIRFENLPVRGPYPEDPRRRWLVAGTGPANHGAAAARGRWIAPLDHDDELLPGHIEQLLAEARRTRAEFVYGELAVYDAATGADTGRRIGSWPPVHGGIGLQASMYHAGLEREGVRLDPFAWLGGEPGDWNLIRRFWEAGVRCSRLAEPVTNYYFELPPGS